MSNFLRVNSIDRRKWDKEFFQAKNVTSKGSKLARIVA